VKEVIKAQHKTLGTINVIFTTNPYLLEINKQFLNHNYFTDVITFNYNERNLISGDIYISVDQVKENSKDLSVTFESEIFRVIIHGVLHLLDYNDSSEVDLRKMREKENEALEMLEGLSNGKNV
jgi:rRNA maturation RNase YbeY